MNDLLNFQDIVERAKKAFKINEDKEISDIIGMSNQAFYNRKKTKSLPYDELLLAANKRNIDFNWLLTGEGEMYKNAVNEQKSSYGSEKTRKMAELFDDLDTDGQREILSRLEEKKRLSELEFIVDRLQKKVG